MRAYTKELNEIKNIFLFKMGNKESCSRVLLQLTRLDDNFPVTPKEVQMVEEVHRGMQAGGDDAIQLFLQTYRKSSKYLLHII